MRLGQRGQAYSQVPYGMLRLKVPRARNRAQARRIFQKVVVPPKAGKVRQSPRELEVLRLLADVHGYKTAATQLGVSVDTIRFTCGTSMYVRACIRNPRLLRRPYWQGLL